MHFFQLILFKNIVEGYRGTPYIIRMQIGYITIIIMLSFAGVNSYNHRYFNPQRKKPFVHPTIVKVTKPYLRSKGPCHSLPYKSAYVNKRPKESRNDKNENYLPLWTELLEVKP